MSAKMLKSALTMLVIIVMRPITVSADWTPLVTSSMFDGIRADTLTAVGGIMSVLLIVLGVGILIRVLTR